MDLSQLQNSGDLVDETICFSALTKDELMKYLESKNVFDKEKIIKESNYEKYNYKKIAKLIKSDNLIKN